ncbi:virion structural protein [Pseudomonas phage 201phi2-1]|uniref:Virion structural protein n=1 Tax=Pseudomonas phage 201phi2-1 TaxID=198110 RepID=B3FJV0_BP201|nr:virion structural protein [Pseudomonas phage 201phi2-1]ABY63265.1 virion structural protein [Pseudomonas phage 201phi2-1]
MLIQLKWLDPNTGSVHKTEIYRSTSPFERPDEAALIATVDNGISTYLDTDVEQGLTYYYRFKSVTGQDASPMSKLFAFDANPYTGPGNSRTVFGDERFGYYDVFPSDGATIPSLNYVRNILGLSPLDESLNTYPHKFAVGGSVRGTFSYPVALGTEISLQDTQVQTLISGQPIKFTMGLHEWALLVPSAVHSSNTEHDIEHFPGELRSMLGVITEMYSRIEDADTGNKTGNRLGINNGQVKFYDTLTQRYPSDTVKWILTCDWTDTTGTSINWTTATGPAPARPKELHVEDVDYSVTSNWDSTLIWPVLVYTGLTGPIDGS